MLGAYKKHPQAYLLYVEDCFLLSDNADTRIFSKDTKKIILRTPRRLKRQTIKNYKAFYSMSRLAE